MTTPPAIRPLDAFDFLFRFERYCDRYAETCAEEAVRAHRNAAGATMTSAETAAETAAESAAEAGPELQAIREQARQRALQRADDARRTLAVGFTWTSRAVLLAALLGIPLAHGLPAPPSLLLSSLDAAGTALALVGTLGAIGGEEGSFGGSTPPERVNDYLVRWLYTIGTFLYFLSVFWDREWSDGVLALVRHLPLARG